MLFLSSNETQVYQELLENAIYLGITTTSPNEALSKIAQQTRNRTITIASLKTFLHTQMSRNA